MSTVFPAPESKPTTTLQIRNVPSELSLEMKLRASAAGMSLSEYLLQEIKKISERPSPEEVQCRIAAKPVIEVPGIVEMVREMRGD